MDWKLTGWKRNLAVVLFGFITLFELYWVPAYPAVEAYAWFSPALLTAKAVAGLLGITGIVHAKIKK